MLPTLEEVIEIIKSGDKKRGRELLANILQADLENEKAWLWLSGVVDSDEERRKCLNRILEINPDNRAARRGLAMLDKKQTGSSSQAALPPAEFQPKPAASLSARLAARQKKRSDQPKQADPLPDGASTDRVEPVSPHTEPATPQPEQIALPQPETLAPAEPILPEPEISPMPQPEQVNLAESDVSVTPVEPVLPESEISPMPQPEQVNLAESDVSATPVEPPLPAQIEARPEDETEDEIEPEIPMEDVVLVAYRQIEPRLPIFVQPALRRVVEYWETERGKTVIGLGLVGLLLTCTACIIFGLVFQPVIQQVPPTLAAIVGTETPTPTSTPIPPTSTGTPTVTPTPTDTPTLTATPTNTQVVFDTPTVTPTPTRTSTPTPTPTPIVQIVIAIVNDIEEYVDIKNTSNEPQDLAGWTLLSERDTQECPLAGIIQPGETLRIWALLADDGQGGYNCGFEQNIWSDTEPDAAVLYDFNGVEVFRLD